ncbi:ABC transporter G family member 23-like isoform X2 [Daktulosphaira vitifoliae]|uniref:ABC transporter G family member 23-like isoform X2 n=1 Tax=Daktulosphaira vitifoliae TaxID=58002 RepID=UPI0021A9B6F5|nr:ABC transporter G family member 23-like isoform X2 [Daktulosphaira vitifoliae]
MMEEPSSLMLQISNAFKKLDKNKIVINNFSMTVPSGCIYGLLGPSGCGKTTLLNSILGVQHLDSGTINLQVESLSDIGYMPQDICLDQYITVNETLTYFGILYKIDNDTIKSRTQDLKKILEIDFLNSFIKDLSGGQRRRVSLAVCLLHDPKLIILDEPTVGLDLILSVNIWNHFVNLAKNNGKTIIITTHYIQEASQADKIGFMRNGKILKECSPKSLLDQYDTDSLEIAFIKLCEEQPINENENISLPKNTNRNKTLLEKNHSNFSRHKIKALIKKNWFIFSRDILYMMFVLLLPFAQMFNFNLTSGTSFKDINIAILNYEANTSSCTNAVDLNSCLLENDFNGTLSCDMINYLRSLDYNILYIKNNDDGIKAVNKGRAVAFIHFHYNYSKELLRFVNYDDNYSQESTGIAYLDNGNFLIKQQMINDIYNGIQFILDNAVSKCAANKKGIQHPLKITKLYGDKVQILRHEIMAKIIVLFVFYFSSIYSASFLLMAKMEGLLIRSIIAGVTIKDLLISLLINNTLVSFIQITIMMLICYICFNNPFAISRNLYLVIVTFILTSATGFFYGTFVAAISKNSTEVMFMTFGSTIAQTFIGGLITSIIQIYFILRYDVVKMCERYSSTKIYRIIMYVVKSIVWPLEAQNSVLKVMSENLPITVCGQLINNVLVKSWSIMHPLILIDLIKSISNLLLHIIAVVFLKFIIKDPWNIQK